MQIKYEEKILHFTDDSNPALPLKVYRESPIMGWDIPIRWAIDAEDQCYGEFSAHGSTMERVTQASLLSALRINEDFSGEDFVRQHFGLKPKAPAWMKSAKAAGWTPPQDFNEKEWEW